MVGGRVEMDGAEGTVTEVSPGGVCTVHWDDGDVGLVYPSHFIVGLVSEL